MTYVTLPVIINKYNKKDTNNNNNNNNNSNDNNNKKKKNNNNINKNIIKTCINLLQYKNYKIELILITFKLIALMSNNYLNSGISAGRCSIYFLILGISWMVSFRASKFE